MHVFLLSCLTMIVACSTTIAAETRPVTRLADDPTDPKAIADRLGCTHAAGTYSFTKGDSLNEGADRILSLGMRVIKAYLQDPQKMYPHNSQWPEFDSLVQMAAHPFYRRFFKKPFSTFVLTTYAVKPDGGTFNWRDGVSDDEYRAVEEQFYELTRYLLRTYRGTRKTFVLQHWEGDWAIRGSFSKEAKDDPSDTAIAGMIRWLGARQAGVERARKETPDSDVRVYHACEVNLVDIAMKGRRTVTNNVVPHTRCDLYSYSAYDTIAAASADVDKGRVLFRSALDYLASKAPDSPTFGAKNVYVGEFGWPCVPSDQDRNASEEKSLQVIRMTLEESLSWGCPYVIYWQVYDNESRAGKERPTNDQVRGFYLIRPDGTYAPAWDYFASVLRRERHATGSGPAATPANKNGR